MDHLEAQRVMRGRLAGLDSLKIEELFQLPQDASNAHSKALESVTKLAEYLGYTTFPVATEHLYRARLWLKEEPLPKRLPELLEPPAANANIGRCNLRGSPVLYVTSHPGALPAECRMTIGDIGIAVQFDRDIKTEDLNTMLLGIDEGLVFGHDPRVKEHQQYLTSLFGSHFSTYKNLRSRLHEEFVRTDAENDDYVFTSTLCDYYFEHDAGMDAILYPSIANLGIVNNIAVRPGAVFKSYAASKVSLFEVVGATELRYLKGATITTDGDIDWEASVEFDAPQVANVRLIDPSDSRIFSAPWRKG